MLTVLIRFVSRVACLILLASFVMFVNDEAGSASKGQSSIVTGETVAPIIRDSHGRDITHKRSAIRVRIDRASDTLTAPAESLFEGAAPWPMRIMAVLLGLGFWGVLLSFLAKFFSLSAAGRGRGPRRRRGDSDTTNDEFTPVYR